MLNAQALYIAAGVSRAQSEHAIAVLMGRPPAGLSIPHGALSTRVPSIPVRLPSSLLERRPDVAAAEETMRQANAADRRRLRRLFPGHLDHRASSAIPAIRALATARLANPVWSFGASLAQPSVQRRPHRRPGRGGA